MHQSNEPRTLRAAMPRYVTYHPIDKQHPQRIAIDPLPVKTCAYCATLTHEEDTACINCGAPTP